MTAPRRCPLYYGIVYFTQGFVPYRAPKGMGV